MIYIDNMMMLATVGRLTARWSHLTADTYDELHAFAQAIGLRRAWFQEPKFWPDNEAVRALEKKRGVKLVGEERTRGHYDVTDSKRTLAIKRGAIPVSLGREPWRAKARTDFSHIFGADDVQKPGEQAGQEETPQAGDHPATGQIPAQPPP